jgi:hypothetical protein
MVLKLLPVPEPVSVPAARLHIGSKRSLPDYVFKENRSGPLSLSLSSIRAIFNVVERHSFTKHKSSQNYKPNKLPQTFHINPNLS